jgi:hypothetical protein
MFFKIVITVLCAVLVLILVTASAVLAAVLAAAGALSVFVAVGCIAGILRNVATDLAPQAMLFTGLSGVFGALSVAAALYILCPRIIKRFNSTVENIFS